MARVFSNRVETTLAKLNIPYVLTLGGIRAKGGLLLLESDGRVRIRIPKIERND